MDTLHVSAAKTETSPGEFVTDGFEVTTAGMSLYQSRSPLKAAIKAIVLLGQEKFAGFTVSFEDGLPELVGKANLAQRLDAERFLAIRGLALAEPPIDQIVETIKGNEG